jgi:hypothetical protein
MHALPTVGARHVAATLLLTAAAFVASRSDVVLSFDDASGSTAAAQPDPTGQSDAERLETLRASIRAAIAVLDDKEMRKFLKEHVDPFWLARNASGGKISIDALIDERILSDTQRDRTEFMMERFRETLQSTLEQEPHWVFDGRAASFMDEGGSSHTAEFWVYFDGRWWISPET